MIINLNTAAEYKLHVQKAGSLLSRLVGLLSTEVPVMNLALHIQPCQSIHTFGMKYAIDVLFLDKHNRIIQVCKQLQPNTIPKSAKGTASVLELAPGTLDKFHFQIGNRLQLRGESEYQPDMTAIQNLFHWPLNIMIALFWSVFLFSAGTHAIQYPHPMNFGILIHNTILLILFLTRRKSIVTSSRFLDWIIPVCTLIWTMFLRPAPHSVQEFNLISTVFQYAGLTGIILSLLSLGRSFGVIPANRRIMTRGLYRFVRHPLYVSEIIFHAGFFLGNMTLENGLLICLILAGQLWRSISEEKLLTTDSAYRKYKEQVQFRFIPGLF